MKIRVIEEETFNILKEKFESFSERIKKLCGEDKSEEWLDNQDVCNLLQISKRTLQSYRDRGILGYSQIGHKCYYRKKDIEELLNRFG